MATDCEIIIVGGGIGGSAAAFRAVQYHRKVVWIRGDKQTARKSRSQWVGNIDNAIGIHSGIVRSKIAKLLKGPEFAEARAVIEQAGAMEISGRDILQNTRERIDQDYSDFIEIVAAAADRAERQDDQFVVHCGDEVYRAPYMLLSTGVMDRQPMIKRTQGADVVDAPKWIYPFANKETVLYCIRCEGHLTADTRTAVLGHSESAAQLAMMLHERYGSACAVLTNGEQPQWAADSSKLLGLYGISVYTSRITDLTGDKGKLHTILLEDGTELSMKFALVSLGLFRVYNELACQLGAELTNPEEPVETRHVQIDQRGETSVHNLFAIGDMSRHADASVMKQLYTCQEYAVRAVDLIDARVRRAHRQAKMSRS